MDVTPEVAPRSGGACPNTAVTGSDPRIEEALTRWSCPGNIFYVGCALIAVGICYSKSLPAEKLVLNFFMGSGFGVLSFWGHSVLGHLDVTVWFAIISAANFVMLAYYTRESLETLKGPAPEAESLYTELFAPMNVDTKSFNDLIAASEGPKEIEANDLFAAEGQRNSGQELSVLLSGKLVATQNDQPLHTILPGQFMDSPEWEAYDPNNNRPFRVTIVAEEESTYLTWKREKLERLMRTSPYLDHMMNLVIGRDIAYKLYNTTTPIWTKGGHASSLRQSRDDPQEETPSVVSPNSSLDSKHSEI